MNEDLNIVTGEVVRLAELARIEPGEGFGIIRDHVFLGCEILGPAVVLGTALGKLSLIDCTFGGKAKSTFWGLPEGEYEGVIALVNCEFNHCFFTGVAFAMISTESMRPRENGRFDTGIED